MLVRGKWVLAGSGTDRRIIKDGAVYIEDTLISDIKYEELRKHYYDVELGSEKHGYISTFTPICIESNIKAVIVGSKPAYARIL
jgi:hypothetical protein